MYVCVNCSIFSDSLQPHGLSPARILCPWNSPDKNIGVGCHSLLQGIFPTQGSNPGLLHGRLLLYHLSHHKMTGWIQRPITLLPVDSGYNISWPTRMVAVSDLQVSAPGAHGSVLLLHRLCNVETVM